MPRDPESWLWRLSEQLEQGPVEEIEDAELQAYRDGELSEAACERIEWALTRDPATRARLIALAGGVADRSGGTLRDRALGLESRPRASRALWRLAAAAALLLAVALPLALWWNGNEIEPAFERVAFDVRVEGMTDVRTAPEGDPTVARAQPDTWLSIFVEPDASVTDRLDFALYRLEGERLERLDESEVEIEVARGAARFRVRAGALVPATPGTHTFYVAVGARAELPSSADDLASLERTTSGKIYPRAIRIEGEQP